MAWRRRRPVGALKKASPTLSTLSTLAHLLPPLHLPLYLWRRGLVSGESGPPTARSGIFKHQVMWRCGLAPSWPRWRGVSCERLVGGAWASLRPCQTIASIWLAGLN